MTSKTALKKQILGRAALISGTPAGSIWTPSPLVDSQLDLVTDVMDGQSFLESRLLLIPKRHPVTPSSLAATLFQIAALDKIPREAMQAIRAVAYLLEEIEETAIAATAREAVNDELKTMTDHFSTMLQREMEKQFESLSTVTKDLAAIPSKSFKDALLGGGPAPGPNINPRILAREGIKVCQFLVDFSIDSGIRDLSQSNIARKFNEAILEAGGNAAAHRIRSVERLANNGILGEFLTDDGAKWLAQPNHADAFIAAFGVLGVGASIKKRNHPIIAYYVPLHLNTNNPAHFTEIEERQTCGHLILTFSIPDAANRAKAKGLVICNKKVSAVKYKKEPIRCLKCQGWNYVASECHRTSGCTNQGRQHCVSCSTNDHPSWARDCPTFLRKCREFDLKHLENGLPFYPSQEPWTWAFEPPKSKLWSGPNPTDQIPIQSRAGSQCLRQQQLRFNRAPASLP
ncbi:hypothetical protein BYT27DRAFT_7222087 [Phlegmacium glaucopus]|nr:hypothetical protein BYT27DRAFT_7222087 [Phlegmacium glaucopus]